MDIIYITPEMQEKLDPYGKNREAIMRLFSKSYFEKMNAQIRISSEEIFERYTVNVRKLALNAVTHTPYYAYNSELYDKYGPQGGAMGKDKVIQNLSAYYEHANDTRHFDKALYQGRDYLLRRIKAKIDLVGRPDPYEHQIEIFETYAGIPTGLHKGSFLAETQLCKPFRHMQPVVPGQRRMRQKDRIIFMDAVANVRYIEKEMSVVRNWLRTNLPEYFSAWLKPDDGVNPAITSMVDRRMAVVEADYDKMDQRFSWELVQEMILPIYETLIPGSYLSFAAAIEELFTVPLYLGDELWTGLHNLFSGQVITNDFETEYTVELQLGAVLTRHLKRPITLAQGDDQVLAFDGSEKDARDILKFLVDISGQAAMLIHADEKSRVSNGNDIRFCRKVYYPKARRNAEGIIIGAYPGILALNSIVNPERPLAPSADASATLQRLDNCIGSPDYTMLADMVKRFYKTDLFRPVDQYDLSVVDWWARVYGERWNPQSSPTYQYYTNKYNK